MENDNFIEKYIYKKNKTNVNIQILTGATDLVLICKRRSFLKKYRLILRKNIFQVQNHKF